MINGIAWDFYGSILIASTLVNTWIIYKVFFQHKDKRDMAEEKLAESINKPLWRG